jgi:hypothetical protein
MLDPEDAERDERYEVRQVGRPLPDEVMYELCGVLRLWQIQDEKCQGDGKHTVNQGVKSARTHLAAPGSSNLHGHLLTELLP